MFDWNAIDLHFHTKAGFDRKKRSDEVNFDYESFMDAMVANNIKLASATNHNYVWFGQYSIIKYLLSKVGINYLMGVELDTNKDFLESNNDETLERHIVLIFKDSFSANFQTALIINKLTAEKKSNPEIFFNSEDLFNKIILNRDVIIIPHGNKDRGYLNHPTISEMKEIIYKKSKGFIRVVDQKTDWEMSKLKNAVSKNMENNSLKDVFSVLFTDTRRWNNYIPTGFVINADPTYEGFAQSTFNPQYRFSLFNEIIEPSNHISKIEIKRIESSNSKSIKPGIIYLSPRYNCVIGKSGSGKTLLSYLIKKQLSKDSVSGNEYAFSNDYEIKIYNNKGLELNKNNFFCVNGINIFGQIIKVMDNEHANITSIAQIFKKDYTAKKTINAYIDEYNDRLNSYCGLFNNFKEGISKLTDLFISFKNNITSFIENEEHISLKLPPLSSDYQFIDIEDEEYQLNYSSYISSLEKELEENKDYTKYYESIKQLLMILKSCFESIDDEKKRTFLKNDVTYLKIKAFNTALAKVNGNASSRAEKAVLAREQAETNIKDISKLVISLYLMDRDIKHYDLSIDTKKLENEETLNEELNIVIKESLAKEYFVAFDPLHNCLFKTRGFANKINKEPHDLTNKQQAKTLIDNYIESGIINTDNQKCFASDDAKVDEIFKQEMTIDGENILQLNPGTLAKTYIKYYFGTELLNMNPRPNLIIFDQIENDVDKEYISIEIKDYIQSLKGKIQLLIITHDPIVAVNADPNNYILAKKDLSGISYKSFVIENNETEALNDISKTVDGSIDVLKNRYFIYERGDEDESRNI